MKLSAEKAAIKPVYVLGIYALFVSGCIGINMIPRDRDTITTMTVVELRIREYYRMHGNLPDNLTNLPVLENRFDGLQDGWGRPLGYTKIGESQFRLASLGADGAPGGSGDNADVIELYDVSKNDN